MPDLQRGRPLIFQHVEANAADLVDVGMIDFCKKTNFWGHHGVTVRQEEFEFEESASVGRFVWPV